MRKLLAIGSVIALSLLSFNETEAIFFPGDWTASSGHSSMDGYASIITATPSYISLYCIGDTGTCYSIGATGVDIYEGPGGGFGDLVDLWNDDPMN